MDNYKFNEKINKKTNFNELIGIIYNTYIKYKNNYYNSININNIYNTYINNDNNNINKLNKNQNKIDNHETRINEKDKKINEYKTKRKTRHNIIKN